MNGGYGWTEPPTTALLSGTAFFYLIVPPAFVMDGNMPLKITSKTGIRRTFKKQFV